MDTSSNKLVNKAENSKVIAVLAVPTKFKSPKCCGRTLCPVAAGITTVHDHMIVPAPVAPSRRLIFSFVSTGAVVAPAENEIESQTCRTPAPPAALEAEALVLTAGVLTTCQRGPFSASRVPFAVAADWLAAELRPVAVTPSLILIEPMMADPGGKGFEIWIGPVPEDSRRVMELLGVVPDLFLTRKYWNPERFPTNIPVVAALKERVLAKGPSIRHTTVTQFPSEPVVESKEPSK